ncbi:MAG TPA: YkvA family protein, partial [Rhabdaerophilum sp.]|nr:YkvA family protein [Rhabdaerophilum sp.]
ALVRKLARQLPFAEDVLAAYHCVRDPATSFRVRFTLLAALAYFVMPIDAVPDFMPVLGFTDDAAVIAAAIASVRGAILPEHRERARRSLDDAD